MRDYSRWRSEDAHRNALNAHCYWRLRREGRGVADATAMLARLSVAEKNALLFQRGVNFNDLPNWQKRGTGLYRETYAKETRNPRMGVTVLAERRRIKLDSGPPMKDACDAFIVSLLEDVGR